MSQIDEEHPARVRTRRVSRARSIASSTSSSSVSPVQPASPAAASVPDPASSLNGSAAEAAPGPVPPLLRPGPGVRLLAAVVLAAVIGLVGGGAAAWIIYLHLGPAQRTITQLITGPSGAEAQTIGQLAQSKAASVVTIATQPVSAASLAPGRGWLCQRGGGQLGWIDPDQRPGGARRQPAPGWPSRRSRLRRGDRRHRPRPRAGGPARGRGNRSHPDLAVDHRSGGGRLRGRRIQHVGDGAERGRRHGQRGRSRR